jgi:hypothetical protein
LIFLLRQPFFLMRRDYRPVGEQASGGVVAVVNS